MPKVWHYNSIYFLSYAHSGYFQGIAFNDGSIPTCRAETKITKRKISENN